MFDLQFLTVGFSYFYRFLFVGCKIVSTFGPNFAPPVWMARDSSALWLRLRFQFPYRLNRADYFE